MPGYDIAGALQYAQPGSAFNKGALDAAQTKLTEANAIVAEKEGKYYEKNLDLKQQQVDNQKAATQVDADQLALKYTEFYKKLSDGGMTEDQQRALAFHEKLNDQGLDMYQLLRDHGVPDKEATGAVNSAFSKIVPNGQGKQAFDPVLAQAMRMSAKDNTTEPQLRQVSPPGQKPYTANVLTDKRSGQAFVVDESGNRKPLNSAWLSAAPTEQRTGPIKQEEVKVRDQQVAATNFISAAKDALGLLKSNKDANTYFARFAQLTGDVQAEASAFANNLGIPFDPGILDVSKYQGTWNDLKIKSAEMESVIVSLAFKAAAAADQKGNGVSEKDIQRFIKEIGAHNANPAAFTQTLMDVARRTDREFKESYKVHMEGKEFKGSTGLDALEKQFRSGDSDAVRTSKSGVKFTIVPNE